MQTSITPQKQAASGTVSTGNGISSGRDADSVVFSSASKSITVSKPVLKVENGMAVLSAEVSGAITGTCFYSTELAYRDYVDDISSNCFLVGLLFSAMYAGCDLVLEGAVSAKLLFHVRYFLIPMLVDYFEGRLHPVRIQAPELPSNARFEADAVGTGFSGGIDSFHTIRSFYLDYDGPDEDKINTLLFFNVGSHGMGQGRERLAWLEKKFQERRSVLSGYPRALGLPFVIVDSNLFSFIQSGHLQTSTLASCSAALFLGKRLRQYYLGSAGCLYHDYFYPGMSFHKDYTITRIDDFILPHICTESFSATSGGSRHSRTQTTMAICSDPLVQKYLNVCNDHDTIAKNCSLCYKCKRTLLTLDILGVIDRFSESFDLGKFDRRARARYIATVLNDRKKDPLMEDIYNLAEQRHYDLRSRTSLPIRLYMKFTETKLFSRLRAILRRG